MALSRMPSFNAATAPCAARRPERSRRGRPRSSAGIEAVMLALPELNTEAMAKLAWFADLEKGGDSWDDEPRLPVGQPGGGQWTTGGAPGASAPRPQLRPSARHRRSNGTTVNAQPGQLPQRNPNASKPRGAGPVSRVPGTPAERPTQPKTPSANPVAALVDVSNSVASTLVDAANLAQQTATHVPILPEIASGEPGFPMGAAWEETTDLNLFREWHARSAIWKRPPTQWVLWARWSWRPAPSQKPPRPPP